MSEILEQITQRDIFMLLCGGGIVASLSLIFRAILDKLFELYDAKKRNNRPFDGWRGGRL